jgi:glutamate N-acetyltransferase/amino-acid N-acetyltransferase
VFSEISGGVTSPGGFLASGIHCGVKKAKKDLALVYSTAPAVASAVFTRNKVPAAPVMVDRLQLSSSSRMRAVLVNSGNANACTGERGLNDAWSMVVETAAALGIPSKEVLIASTGVIGQYLPIGKISAGIKVAASELSPDGSSDAAQAITTTDTFVKEVAVRFSLGGANVTIGGMAKGSGMIAPNMATMLAFVTTDAVVTPDVLRHVLKRSVDRSFNRISVDGDTSTNDMVVVLANGLARNDPICVTEGPGYDAFYEALEYLLVKLAKMIVTDGEGATKFVEVKVIGAASEETAVQAARAIANSNLVKTAIHGEDANWGRILAAVGNSGISFDPAGVEIWIGDVQILRRNYCIGFSEEDARRALSHKELTITVNLNEGNASAAFWTCDLTKEYVAINANYRT